MSLRVFIVTEGGKGLGFGHITRCLSLSQAFKEEGVVSQLLINGDESVKRLLGGEKYQIFNWLKEKERFVNLIQKADIVTVDSYLAGPQIYEAISRITRAPAYIDDNKRLNYPGGFVINANVYAEEMDFPKQKNVTYLLGPRYALLRKEFWSTPKKNTGDKLKSVMITFGGYDGKNMTVKILNALNKKYKGLKKNVIVGAGFRNIKEIRDLKNDTVNIIYGPKPDKLKKIMLQSDIAICAGGQTLYELARIGIPAIAICVAGNQERNLEKWSSLKFIEYIGSYRNKGIFSRLANGIESFLSYDVRARCSKIGRNLIDGKGPRRIIQALLKR